MEDITTVLKDEHKNILRVIKALLNECDSLEKDGKINQDFFKKVTKFIQDYADSYHHAKEEDILFKELCRSDVKMHCNPTGQMLLEHDLGREYIKGLKEGLNEKNVPEIIKNARAYAELLTDHIYKEDNILYPMAEEALSDSKKTNINEEFNKVEKRLKNEKMRYLALVKDIS